MGSADRIDGYQRDHSWLGFPIAVVYKSVEDRAPYLAALIAYYGFVSLFPLLLLLFSILGFVLEGNPELRDQVVRSALQDFPIIGPTLRENVASLRGSGVGLVIGILGTFYGAMGVMQAAQVGFNQIYGVPRHQQPNPIRSRLRSLGLLAVLGTGVLVSTVITALASTTNNLSSQVGTGLQIAIYGLAVSVGAALFTVAFQLLTACELRVRDVITGGIVTAVLWQLLQLQAAPYLSRRLETTDEAYGEFAVVLVALAWIYLQALALVLSAEINVVLNRRLWPRALRTLFSDDVALTDADRRVYSMHLEAHRFKASQSVTTHFGGKGAPPDEPPELVPRGPRD